MWSFFVMIALSLYLMGYGYIALFKKEWLVKIRGAVKNDQQSSGIARARHIMAVASLILGGIGLVMTLVTMVIYFQSLNGGIAI